MVKSLTPVGKRLQAHGKLCCASRPPTSTTAIADVTALAFQLLIAT